MSLVYRKLRDLAVVLAAIFAATVFTNWGWPDFASWEAFSRAYFIVVAIFISVATWTYPGRKP